MPRRSLLPLLRRLPGVPPIDPFVAAMRDGGHSWEDIAQAVRLTYEVEVTGKTVARWFAPAEEAAS